MTRLGQAVAGLSLLLLAGPAVAQDSAVPSGTLKTILGRGSMLVGVREGVIPFAYMNRGGQPVGFSVDLCHGIAEDVAAALNQDLLEADAPAWQRGLRIKYVPVAADARLSMVVSGAIDLECGSTTATEERSKSVAFSPVFFLAGTKLLVRGDSAARSYRDMAGKTVAVSAGTTNAAVMRGLIPATFPPIKVAEFASIDAAFGAMAGGQADAVASDDILLAGLILAHPAPATRMLDELLSFEPYAVMLRRDDADFSALVRQSFGRMASQGRLRALYDRWFLQRLPEGGALRVPMSTQLSAMYQALGQTD